MLSRSPRFHRTRVCALKNTRQRSQVCHLIPTAITHFHSPTPNYLTNHFQQAPHGSRRLVNGRDNPLKRSHPVEGSRCRILVDLHAKIPRVQHPARHHHCRHHAALALFAPRSQQENDAGRDVPAAGHRLPQRVVGRNFVRDERGRLVGAGSEGNGRRLWVWNADALLVHEHGAVDWHLSQGVNFWLVLRLKLVMN
jgi:hypothetical protein